MTTPSTSYCAIDDTDEPVTPTTFLVCIECGHVYETAALLMEDVRKYIDKDALRIKSVADVMFCPLCLHDFPFLLEETTP